MYGDEGGVGGVCMVMRVRISVYNEGGEDGDECEDKG